MLADQLGLATSSCVVIAPMTMVSPSSRMPRRPSSRAEVDDLLGCVEPHAQDRQQGLAAGEDLRLVAGLGSPRAHPRRMWGDVFER